MTYLRGLNQTYNSLCLQAKVVEPLQQPPDSASKPSGDLAEWYKIEKLVIRSSNSDYTAVHLGGCNFGDGDARIFSELLVAGHQTTNTTYFDTLLSLNLEVCTHSCCCCYCCLPSLSLEVRTEQNLLLTFY